MLAIDRLKCGQKLICGGREIADPSTGRVVAGVNDGGTAPAKSQCADSFTAEWAAMWVILMHEHDPHFANIVTCGKSVTGLYGGPAAKRLVERI
jgi:hypothetical protein